MMEIPVIDEQEFDWEAEQEECDKEIERLQALSARLHDPGDIRTISKAITLIASYAEELEGNR